MDRSSPPNVREIEESYSETWPNLAGMPITFGPVRESCIVHLPQAVMLAKLSVDEQWAWLRSKENSFEATGVFATWGSAYHRERWSLTARLRAHVIEMVNAAVAQSLVRAPKRDPQSGKVVA